jgi:hypothetical protein
MLMSSSDLLSPPVFQTSHWRHQQHRDANEYKQQKAPTKFKRTTRQISKIRSFSIITTIVQLNTPHTHRAVSSPGKL